MIREKAREMGTNRPITDVGFNKELQKNREKDGAQLGVGKLLDGWSFDGKYLYRGSKRIANFILYAKAVRIETEYPSMKRRTYIAIVAVTQDGDCISKDIPFIELKSLDYQMDLGTKCYVGYEFGKNAKGYIYELLCEQIAVIEPTESHLLTQLGYFVINGRRGYNAGNRIIGNMDGLHVRISPTLKSQYFLQVKKDILPMVKNQMFSDYIKSYMQLNIRVMPIVFSYLILGLLRSFFFEAGVAVKFCMFLLGENQSYKTTLATYGCSIYNRLDDIESHIHNLTGSEAKLTQIINTEKDMVAIIDDLNKSDSKATERRQEEKISKLIRMAANNVGKENMSVTYEINSQVLFCGEYTLKNASTNNRLVLLKLEKDDIQKKQLTEFENQAGLLGNFVEDFITWSIENHDSIIKIIKEEYQEYRSKRNEEEIYQERMQTNYKVLDIAYCVADDFFQKNQYSIDFDKQKFRIILENSMAEQIEILELEEQEEEDYVMHLYMALQEFYTDYVFYKKPKPKCWPNKIYHNKENNTMCIPGKTIIDLLSHHLGKEVLVHDVRRQFEICGLLLQDGNKQNSHTKKVYGIRAYCFDYAAWRDYIKENYTSYQ